MSQFTPIEDTTFSFKISIREKQTKVDHSFVVCFVLIQKFYQYKHKINRSMKKLMIDWFWKVTIVCLLIKIELIAKNVFLET